MGDSWPLWTRQGCPRIGFGAARGGSKGVPGRSGRVPEMALGPSDGPRSIFHRCWVDSGWIFCDFRCDIALILLAFSLPLPLLVRLLLDTTSIVSLQFPPSIYIYSLVSRRLYVTIKHLCSSRHAHLMLSYHKKQADHSETKKAPKLNFWGKFCRQKSLLKFWPMGGQKKV